MSLRSAHARQPGFTLLELLVAVSILLITSLAITAAVVSAQHALSRSAAGARVQAEAASVLEELRTLPFGGVGAAALLTSVFPHARPELGSSDAYFCAEARGSHPAGTFFTYLRLDGAAARVAATFVRAEGGGWSPVPVAALAGYTPAAPPSDALLVCVTPASGTSSRTLATVLRGRVTPAEGVGAGGL